MKTLAPKQTICVLIGLTLFSLPAANAFAADTATTELKSATLNGAINDGKARLVIEADLTGLKSDKDKLLFATSLNHSLRVTRDKLSHSFTVKLDILQGEAREIPLALAGEGEIRQVTGDGLLDWGIRQEAKGARFLVLRFPKSDKPLVQFVGVVAAETELKDLPASITPLALAPPLPALLNGYVKVETDAELAVEAVSPSGLVPVENQFLPEALRSSPKANEPEPLAFRCQGAAYSLPLKITVADPETRQVVLRDFKLAGQLGDSTATFTLSATARVRNPKGGMLDLLSGGVALTDLAGPADWRLKFDQGRFVLVFDRAGEFPLQFKFNAIVRPSNSWNTVDFRIAPAALQPVVFPGLAADTQFQFADAARPERRGSDFASFLPANGAVSLAWKEAKPEAEGKLFYSAEALSQVTISPGLMRQLAVLDFKVMQGELSRVVLLLTGAGEVTRVQGEPVLAWNVEPGPSPATRRLVVQFNQPHKDQFALQVQMQTPLGAFPQTVNAVQVRPESATRYAGYCRILNEGAVRLEVLQATGLSQISPEQFPETDVTKTLLRVTGNQRFAFRFSGAEFALRIQADNVLPEVAVSQVLAYHLGETELAVDAEIELDIREAPLREAVLRVPKGYALTRLNATGLSDQFLREPADQPDAELRLVYGSPISGRQVIQLRLERNQPLAGATWALPRLEVIKAKSTRGHVGISADAGYRLTPERVQGLTEIATAFFPKKLTGIQAAFRLSDPVWQASLRVERLPQSMQADALHLFSVGEGIAYGSSVINYLISGAPIATFKVELSDEYFNVEFTGKDVRNWQKTAGGYQVQLHTPVSGAYTLLATYERPFKTQGETLAFTGARPLDAQSEQGYTIVVSAYQFQVKPVNVSAGLLALEPGEVPPEYRLFFDAPILAAYRYTSRPFNVQLALSPLVQGETLSQVVDRASFTTRISKEGQVLTEVTCFVKNRGFPHLRLTLPDDTQLWSATVNGALTVPVIDNKANLIPLPQRADPNAVLRLDLKLAARSPNPKRVTIRAPILSAPVLLTEWKLEPDAGQRLVYRKGALTPTGGIPDVSGFAGLARLFTGPSAGEAWTQLAFAFVFVLITALAWRWAGQEGTHMFSVRYWAGALVGLCAFVLAVVALVELGDLAGQGCQSVPRNITLLAPVQQTSSALFVEVYNLSDEETVWAWIGRGWPALLAVGVWLYGAVTGRTWFRVGGWILGWTLLAWATLRWPNGAPAFLGVFGLFLLVHLVVPACRRLWQMPRKPKPASPPPEGGAAPVVAAILLFVCAAQLCGTPQASGAPAASISSGPGRSTALSKEAPFAESVIQQIRVEEKFALATARIRWPAIKGQLLPLLYAPAVLTDISYPTNALKLVQTVTDSKRAYLVLAQEAGAFEVEVQYQLQVVKKDGESGFSLPTQCGLVNRLTVTLADLDVDVTAAQAVSVQRDTTAPTNQTVATLVLAPANEVWIGWKPRSRDVKREKPVFYAEQFQLYVPSAGVIEGAHQVQIRPAQGELSELTFDVPSGATITDVLDPAGRTAPVDAKNPKTPGTSTSIVSLWRFDPDVRKLRVGLNPPQSRPFALLIKSQIATGSLPVEQAVGLLAVNSAASQIGLLGFATGPEVQLDSVTAESFSSINLEDFPAGALQALQPPLTGLTLRRAYRYADARGTASLKASPVEPDVRVETQQTLSLGEDRTVLAANVSVDIIRAGIFRLSFVLPSNLDVESLSGSALSHWTELKTDAGRVITLHLRGKTEGKQAFTISLAGPGVKATPGWAVPRLALREASKQQGMLLLVPEQGMRLQVTTREGVTQLDPQKSGIRQKGVLAFRLLQSGWTLALDIEQVDPWVQVLGLQHVTVSEAQIKVAANLQYQIENTGLKSLRVRLPADAESVRFRGEQVADFLKREVPVSDGLQEWEVKLNRRVIGRNVFQVTYQVPVREQATNAIVHGVQALDVNLQRGFLTVQSGGRLQVRAETPPATLQPTEWQSIPRTLRQDLQAASANYTFRLVEPAYQLPIVLERHEAAKLLPARVNNITLTSVISDDGVMLTQVRLEMIPGDKRLLHLTLPDRARFWFAFVNQSGVWPWREKDQILIPLEQQSRAGQALALELFYSSQIGAPAARSFDWELLGPKFDLPLENIAWRIYLSEKWQLKDWTGTLQLQGQQIASQPAAVNLETYLQQEVNLQREKSREAEQMLARGNTLLEQGDPQQARRAFQSAYGLSTHDDAFNEDARVQLHNLKLQQALMGLNARQAAASGETEAVTAKLRNLRGGKGAAYTQQEAKEIIDRNSAEENAAFMRLAERLIQQQDAAVASPAAIRASIPEQGRLLTFTRAVQVDTWADLKIRLAARAVRVASWSVKLLLLSGVFAWLALLAWLARGLRAGKAPAEG